MNTLMRHIGQPPRRRVAGPVAGLVAGRGGTVLIIAIALLAVPSVASAQCGWDGAWWRSTAVGQRINLTSDQRSRIEASYEAARPRLRELQTALMEQQRTLDKTMRQPETSRADVDRGIEAVEQARTALSKARAHMLIDMRQVLDATQRKTLLDLAYSGCDASSSSGRRQSSGQRRPRDQRRPR